MLAVGVGIVKVWLAVVWAIDIAVYTSTVVAAVPIEPPVAKSVLASTALTVDPLLISVDPDPAETPTETLPPAPACNDIALAPVPPWISVVDAALVEPIVTVWAAPAAVAMLTVWAVAPLNSVAVALDSILTVELVLPIVKAVVDAAVVPIPNVADTASTNGVKMLVLAWPVPVILKLAVWLEVFWFKIELASAPANVQAVPFHINVAVVPVEIVAPSIVKLAVPMLLM